MTRYTAPTTTQALADAIRTVFIQPVHDPNTPDVLGFQNQMDFEDGILRAREDDIPLPPRLKQDILGETPGRIGYDAAYFDETVDGDNPLLPYLGYKQLHHLTYYGILLGVNDHPPVYAALYLDESESLRLYVPRRGNAFNPLNGRIIGNDGAKDDAYARQLGYAERIDLDMGDSDQLASHYDLDELSFLDDLLRTVTLRP